MAIMIQIYCHHLPAFTKEITVSYEFLGGKSPSIRKVKGTLHDALSREGLQKYRIPFKRNITLKGLSPRDRFPLEGIHWQCLINKPGCTKGHVILEILGWPSILSRNFEDPIIPYMDVWLPPESPSLCHNFY